MRATVDPPVATVERGQEWVSFAHLVRGPACVLVVLTHLGQQFPTVQAEVAPIGHFPPVAGLPEVAWAPVLRALAVPHIGLGAIAVSLFFLVSGFVIPFALERRNLRGFVVRRFFRLYPTLWVCLLLTVLVLVVQRRLLGTPFPYGRGDLAANASLLAEYVRRPWVEPVLWSLAVEELFYVIAAVLAWRGLLARRGAVVAVAVGLVAIGFVTDRTPAGGPLWWLGFNATCVSFVLVGVVAHQVYRGRWRPSDGIAVGAIVLAGWYLGLYTGPMAPQAQVYGPSSSVGLVVFAGLYLARDRIPYSATVDRLSNLTYPLYLVHHVNGYVVMRAVFAATGNFYVALLVAVVASLALAMVIHVVVEVPTNAFGRRLARGQGWRREPRTARETVPTSPAPGGQL